MDRQKLVLFIALLLIIILPRYSQAGGDVRVQRDHISGRIYYLADHKGISNLVVKLTPSHIGIIGPVQKITSVTDQDGKFIFQNLPKWRYLFEVYNGPALLYRDVVDTNKETNKNIILRGKEKVYEPNIKLKIIPSEFKYE